VRASTCTPPRLSIFLISSSLSPLQKTRNVSKIAPGGRQCHCRRHRRGALLPVPIPASPPPLFPSPAFFQNQMVHVNAGRHVLHLKTALEPPDSRRRGTPMWRAHLHKYIPPSLSYSHHFLGSKIRPKCGKTRCQVPSRRHSCERRRKMWRACQHSTSLSLSLFLYSHYFPRNENTTQAQEDARLTGKRPPRPQSRADSASKCN